jgi:CheY-like chemotaxis protein
VDGLADLIRHYKLDCEVKQLVDLVASALVVEECAVAKKKEGETIVQPGAAPLAGRRILVVDDEEDARTYLSTVLADAGATIIVAADGDQALKLSQAEKPDLITLDLSMPGKDGVEVFRELRHDPNTSDIPVCVVTGHPEFREVIYDVQVDKPEGFMNKPVSPEDLVDGVRRIFELKAKKA